jgi:anaerobic selenocysteine-containing dehydrogenase
MGKCGNPEVKNKKVIKTTCKSCHGGCGVLVTVEEGVITHIEGNPETPTRGTMCAKGLSSIQHVGHPDRLKYPLRRTGKRGEGKWKRISWEEALDAIAQKMKESIDNHGPQSIAISQGTGRGYNRYTHRLARSIGTANIITPGYIGRSWVMAGYTVIIMGGGENIPRHRYPGESSSK